MKYLIVILALAIVSCQPNTEKKDNNQDVAMDAMDMPNDQLAAEWQSMSEEIAELGPWLMNQPDVLTDDPQVVSDGYRYLATLLYSGLHNHLLNADVDRPKFITNFDDRAGWTGDHRDGIYRCANIDPQGSYRIIFKPQEGQLPATATLQTMTGFWQDGLGGKTISTKNLYDFQPNNDNSYEVILSKQPQGVNHYPLEENAHAFMLREYLPIDAVHKRYHVSIERIDKPISIPNESDSEDVLSKKLDNTVEVVKVVATEFLKMTRICRSTINGIEEIEDASAFGGSKENKYYFGSWDMSENEALIIEVKPIKAAYWSICGLNFWCQGLSHTDIPGEINNYNAVVDPDGIVRIVVSNEDLGYANWISTANLKVGLLLGRFNFIEEEEEVSYQKVQLDDLASTMPADSKTVTPEERMVQLQKIRMGVIGRYDR